MTRGLQSPDLDRRLAVCIARRGRTVDRVRIRSTPPIPARRVLAGRRAADALAIVPLLFSLCRHAHSGAARGAIAAASGHLEGGDRGAHDVTVVLETLQEHLSHLLLDLPRAIDCDVSHETLRDLRRRILAAMQAVAEGAGGRRGSTLRELAATIEAAAAREIYGVAPSEWLELEGCDGVRAWASRRATLPARMVDALLADDPTLGSCAIALMPAVRSEALRHVVVPAMASDEQFSAAPTWAGEAVETGALARLREHPLVSDVLARCGSSIVARIVARAVELAMLIDALVDEARLEDDLRARVQGLPIAPGEGAAAVQTARGLLIHRARVIDGLVADYQIVAPTEWNFHPDGAVVRAVGDLTADSVDALAHRAALTVRAIDPCVDCRVEIDDA